MKAWLFALLTLIKTPVLAAEKNRIDERMELIMLRLVYKQQNALWMGEYCKRVGCNYDYARDAREAEIRLKALVFAVCGGGVLIDGDTSELRCSGY